MNPQFVAIGKAFGKTFVAALAYTVTYESITYWLNRPKAIKK